MEAQPARAAAQPAIAPPLPAAEAAARAPQPAGATARAVTEEQLIEVSEEIYDRFSDEIDKKALEALGWKYDSNSGNYSKWDALTKKETALTKDELQDQLGDRLEKEIVKILTKKAESVIRSRNIGSLVREGQEQQRELDQIVKRGQTLDQEMKQAKETLQAGMEKLLKESAKNKSEYGRKLTEEIRHLEGKIQTESATAATRASIQAMQSEMTDFMRQVHKANQDVARAVQQAAQQAAADRAAAAAQQAAQPVAQPAAPVSAPGAAAPAPAAPAPAAPVAALAAPGTTTQPQSGWGPPGVPISIETNRSTGNEVHYISKEIMQLFMRQEGIQLDPGNEGQQRDILNRFFMGHNGQKAATDFGHGPGLCPNGFVYHPEGNGVWRCGGGSHAIQFPQ